MFLKNWEWLIELFVTHIRTTVDICSVLGITSYYEIECFDDVKLQNQNGNSVWAPTNWIKWIGFILDVCFSTDRRWQHNPFVSTSCNVQYLPTIRTMSCDVLGGCKQFRYFPLNCINQKTVFNGPVDGHYKVTLVVHWRCRSCRAVGPALKADYWC